MTVKATAGRSEVKALCGGKTEESSTPSPNATGARVETSVPLSSGQSKTFNRRETSVMNNQPNSGHRLPNGAQKAKNCGICRAKSQLNLHLHLPSFFCYKKSVFGHVSDS